jgi:hypothetical protein
VGNDYVSLSDPESDERAILHGFARKSIAEGIAKA